MINILKKNTMIEEAALEGNFDIVKQIVAMHGSYLMVTGKTLATLLSKQMLNGDGFVHFTDIALYLMENAVWDQTEVERELKSLGVLLPFKIWNIKGSATPSRCHSQKRWMLRQAFTEQELRSAIEANDLDAFVRIHDRHFSEDGLSVKAVNYLPDSFLYEFQQALLDYDLEDVNEDLSPKIKLIWPFMLTIVLRDVAPTNIVFMAKFLELGVSISSFETVVGKPVEQWCEENNCNDLLELDEVKQRIAKERMEKKIQELFSISFMPPPILKKIECTNGTPKASIWPVDSNVGPYLPVSTDDVNMIKNYLKTYFANDAKLGVDKLNSFCFVGISTAYDLDKLKPAIDTCVPEQQAQMLQAFTQYNQQNTINHTTFWEWAAYVNQAELLTLPHVLPKSGITCMLNKAILHCARLGKVDTLDVLIKHAKLYMPDALRFSKAELDLVRSNGHTNLAQQLSNVRALKTTPAQSVSDRAWATLNYVLEGISDVNREPESYSRLCL